MNCLLIALLTSMKKSKQLLFVILVFTSAVLSGQSQNSDSTLKRADSFLGIHFDLHASESTTDAGKTLTEEMIDTFLTRIRPDFIQIDCKGHPGISSYPTKVGYSVSGFDKDPLKLFRQVTRKNKVGLYMHFSGVWDNKVVKEHPEWAIIKANGERSKKKTSFFSPYLDTYLIPQLKELSDYGVDGAWIDGECWAVEPDYGEASLKRFTSETGITEIPKNPSDTYYPEFIEYTRSLFREHVEKYVTAIHTYNPDFQITSNWAYSSMMPEKVKIDLDFLSGDVTPQNGVYRSAFEARCLAPQGKHWDLMAWGHSWDGGKMPISVKSAIQLKQEAAQIMAMGGGIQFYYQQNWDLSIKPWLAPIISEIAIFCRERQAYCFKSEAIPQIALIYPSVSHLKYAPKPYSNPVGELKGALKLILDGQHAVEILMEHHLEGKIKDYPLVIIPECKYLDPSSLELVRSYVMEGGHLLLFGAETAKLFQAELGIKSISAAKEGVTHIEASGALGTIRSDLVSVELSPQAEVLSNFYKGSDFRFKGNEIASSVNQFGKGTITGIYFNAGSSYLNYKTPVLRDFVSQHIRTIFPEPLVEVDGSHLIHLSVNTLNEKMYVNLVNVAGEHTNSSAIAYDEIPALKNIEVRIRTSEEPKKLFLQPGKHGLEFSYQNGVSKILIPELEIHSIIEVGF